MKKKEFLILLYNIYILFLYNKYLKIFFMSSLLLNINNLDNVN